MERASVLGRHSSKVPAVIRIAEIFRSVQGEGIFTGSPSIFIRTSGCNLRCWFCDTRYASWEPEGNSMSVDEIIQRVEGWSIRHVVLTGGEPMIFDECPILCAELKRLGKHITIETAGTVNRDCTCDLWSISPKLSNSSPVGYTTGEWIQNHDSRRHTPDIVQSLMQRGDYQLKFVVGSILDAEEVLEYLAELQGWSRDRILMMPRGTTHEELVLQLSWLGDWCRNHDLRLCDRQHIHWFGNKRGT
ncbi:MAG: radical SAM protein [Planctomycetota bacterium]